MPRPVYRKLIRIFLTFLAVWAVIRYLLPLFLPFLLGAALALAAEPVVRFAQVRCRLPRAAAAGFGVCGTFLLLGTLLILLLALVVRELGMLASIVPDLGEGVFRGLSLLQKWLLNAVSAMPQAVQPLLSGAVSDLFSGSTQLLGRVSSSAIALASNVLGKLPGSALSIGTGILASFMISAKLPRIKGWIAPRLPKSWHTRILPALKDLKDAALGWLKAQLRLSLITYGIVCLGLLLLRISYAPVWALAVALVDAIPILGTGTILLPWSLICLLQGDGARAIGLLGLYAVAMLSRSALEPKLVGRQLGLDPLVTLIALYVGFRLWGVLGMLFAPLLAMLSLRLAAFSPGK